ncbi:MAG: lamin tail domain-containing protein, partial [Bacteroidales bacterium]
MKHLLFISFCFVALLSAGQVNETFEEGFPSEALIFPSDRWAISTELPLAGEASLHHIFDNSDAGNDAISWPYNTTLESTPLVWEFLVRYNYNPSSGNHWAFYLASSENAEQMSLEQIADGLVLGVNLSGSDDTLRIWEVADGSYTPWLSTTVNWQDDFEKGAPIALKVALSKESRLSVHINPSGEQGLVEEVGSKELSRRIETQYIGFAYTYTSSADQLLWIDNLYCGPPVADTVAPYLSDWKVISDSSLQLSFSELMNQESLHRKENYQFLTSTHQITEIFTNGETPTSVTLEVSPEIEENRLYNLQLSSLEDLAGNTIHDTLISFVRTKLHAYDLVFNEFMVDPSPPVGLPEKEFIELHNLLPFPVSLEDMELEINGRYHSLPPVTIDSAGFLIITAQEDTALFSNYGDVLGIPALSALTNTSGCIILRDTARTVLDSVAYYSFWYHNNEKADGGWSLERIDPENTCGGSTNWQASTDLIGGTPGQKNACAQPNIDTISPKLVEWYLVSPVQLNICFSEPVHLGLHTAEGGIRLNGNAPKYLHTDEQAMNYVVILNDTLQSPSNNSLHLERIPDFCNNLLTDTTITISYYAPSFGDVVLSELMSDPDPSQGLPAVEYTELFNASAYPVQLKGFVLTVGSNAAELPTYLLMPGEYLALSRESLQPAHIYNSVAVAGFPTLPNTETTLELWSAQNELLHWVSYTVDWHETESKKEGGWSLEMKNTHLPCKQASNWGSSNDKKGGTPGVANSIEHNMPDNHAPKLTEVTPTDSLHLWVQFSEPMARKEISTSLFSIANYGGTIE